MDYEKYKNIVSHINKFVPSPILFIYKHSIVPNIISIVWRIGFLIVRIPLKHNFLDHFLIVEWLVDANTLPNHCRIHIIGIIVYFRHWRNWRPAFFVALNLLCQSIFSNNISLLSLLMSTHNFSPQAKILSFSEEIWTYGGDKITSGVDFFASYFMAFRSLEFSNINK